MLEDAVARTDLELFNFIFNKKPNDFNLSFTTMCVAKGYTEVLEWWKQTELVELFCDAAYSEQWRMMDSLYMNGWQQTPSVLKEKIVNWAAGGGHINALEWLGSGLRNAW
jgi:hypothetical protein